MTQAQDNTKILSTEEKTLISEYPGILTNLTLGDDYLTTPFIIYHAALAHPILGPAPSLSCIFENTSFPFAHEAGVYLPATRDVVITSSRLDSGVTISRIYRRPVTAADEENTDDGDDATTTKGTGKGKATHVWACQELPPETLHAPLMANGATNFGKDGNDVLLCAQGNLDAPSGLVHLTRTSRSTGFGKMWDAKPVLQHFMGRPFNSPNDVVCTRDGLVWFTDPTYGFEQGFRPPPRLPPQVYCFDPRTGGVRVAADGFGHPNGICFSHDERTCYVTDTDWIWGDLSTDDRRASTIYAFDVVKGPTSDPTPSLRNRRVFAMADNGMPDGIKADVHGNVYAGCGDGLNVWGPGGTLAFKVLVPGGVSNFCFCERGKVMLLNETKVWLLKLDPGHKGALLGI